MEAHNGIVADLWTDGDLWQYRCSGKHTQNYFSSRNAISIRRYDYAGFQVFFSFHNTPATPQQLGGGTWNCSVSYWDDFQQHLLCNGDPECLDMKDETNCGTNGFAYTHNEQLRSVSRALAVKRNEIEHVPYTLVCDHRSDCNDDSDEDFCVFPPCDPLLHFMCGKHELQWCSFRVMGRIHGGLGSWDNFFIMHDGGDEDDGPSSAMTSLTVLDLSRLDLEEMDRVLFTVFPNIQTLNLSDSGVDRLHTEGFQPLQQLRNCGSFVYRVFVKSVANNMGYEVFVTHLSVSDFLMGLYLAVIGVADRHYLGTYLWEDTAWRHSPACKVAGFLSLLSNQVSAFIICLITLERFLVVRFPFSDLRFRKRSAQLACAVAWVAGHVVAAVPLIPATSHWQFYSQTGICIPLPVTRADFPGHGYSFAIMIVVNFTLFIVIAVGQLLIYSSIRNNEISSNDTTRASKDHDIARREANVLIAVLVLPLNSALNPFLYTMNVIMERRQKAMEERMLKTITSQLTGKREGKRIKDVMQEYTEDEALKIQTDRQTDLTTLFEV
nr:hypothetical protein BaRGS_008264 [Batillaria attramentaria]